MQHGAALSAPNNDGDTPLHFASMWARPQAVQALLECGAAYGARNRRSRAPLEVAAAALAGSAPEEVHAAREAVRAAFYTSEPRLRTLVAHHPECQEHQPRNATDWECPARIDAIMERLTGGALFRAYELDVTTNFKRAPAAALRRVHTADYLKFVDGLSRELGAAGAPAAVPFTPMVQRDLMRKAEVKPHEFCDTSFSAGSLGAARRAAGAVVAAVDSVLAGRHRNAFCAVRPPGHHAGPDGLLEAAASCGFCIFNNVAVGALHALEAHGLARVAIVDTDVHHGNGTEEIVRAYCQPSKLLFYSIHLFDKEGGDGKSDESESYSYQFFPGSGSVDDTALNIINAPVQPLWRSRGGRSTKTRSAQAAAASAAAAAGRGSWREAIMARLLPTLRAFNPQLILMSSGFDAVEGDVGNARHARGKCAGTDLTPADYAWITERIQEVADMCCDGRLVSVLEGGYGRPHLDPPDDRRHSRVATASATAPAVAASFSSSATAALRELQSTDSPTTTDDEGGDKPMEVCLCFV
ncbi:hypothetical protein JKP88DRAFT_170043 [Tribonema minus]|uniref:histone deacetylase n=1 Tax=Tribonema minus TaxID=303371 RepID=A0A836C9L4_9STRA|nr:hypothetical protein JKP88DRAFT_170043 [Tribonema minus]